MALTDDRETDAQDHASSGAQRTPRVALATGTTDLSARCDSPEHATAQETWQSRYRLQITITDLLVIAWACAGVHFVAPQLSAVSGQGPFTLRAGLTTLVVVLLWMAALSVADTRDARVVGLGTDEYKRVLTATFGMFAVITMTTFVFDVHLPRTYLLLVMPVGTLGLFTGRWAWRRWLHLQRRHGYNSARVLVVGTRDTITDLIAELRRTPEAGYRVVGACVPGADGAAGQFVAGVPVVGGLGAVAAAMTMAGADAVAITPTPAFGPAAVRRLSWQLERSGVDFILAPGLTDIAGPRIHTQPVSGLPLIHVELPTYTAPAKAFKRAFDFVIASMLVLLASPIFLALALAIKGTDRGSVFFRQERVGIDGSKFRMIKFRSMRVDAEAQLHQLINSIPVDQRGAGNGTLFKMKGDPRITRVGRFIRRYSLDELPQLINVIKGDMSLVGPRPPLPAEVETYGDDVHRRLLVKPGMTGLWQVSGRSDLSWDESVRLDLYYVENWSVAGDLVILAKTAKAVFQSGAY